MSAQPILGFFEGHRDLRAPALYAAAQGVFGQATLLPRLAYRSKAFADLEDESVWTRGWICVGHHDRIPATGDLLPHTVGNHGVHVLRRPDGGLAAHFNFAQHGGCRFVPHQCQTGKKTSCFYTSCGHSRDRDVIAADPDGHDVPEMYMFIGNNPNKLVPIRVATLGTLTFVNLDAGDDLPDASFTQQAAPLRDLVDGSLARVGRFQAEGRFNWKLLGKVAAESASATPPTPMSEENPAGFAMTTDIDDTGAPIGVAWIFPNLLIRVFHDVVMTSIVQPTGLTETLETCDVFARTAPDDPEACVERLTQRVRHDHRAAEALQQTLAGAANPSPFIPQSVDDSPAPREDNALAWSFQQLLISRLLAKHTYIDQPLYGRPGRSLNAGVNA
jgi:hypothetical protein